ncbi:hypothetical protein HN262_21020 [Acinetobacter baumannii]|nr:hypothetical protein [Acinetobacter baumannii]
MQAVQDNFQAWNASATPYLLARAVDHLGSSHKLGIPQPWQSLRDHLQKHDMDERYSLVWHNLMQHGIFTHSRVEDHISE